MTAPRTAPVDVTSRVSPAFERRTSPPIPDRIARSAAVSDVLRRAEELRRPVRPPSAGDDDAPPPAVDPAADPVLYDLLVESTFTRRW